MSEFKMKDVFLKTDVLIIGSGPAGMWAARAIKENLPDCEITIADKGPKDWGGQMCMSGGDFDAVLPEENVEDWVKDLVYYYDGLCEQDVLEKLFTLSYKRMRDYQDLGCEFLNKPDGSLKGVPQRGLDHVKLYPAKYKGRGGEDMANSIGGYIEGLGVKRMSRLMITKLLKQGDRVCGALGFDTITGEFYVFQAKVVLLTCGNCGWKPSYGKNLATGEGLQMAFEAGAEMRNFEFAKVWNVPKLFGWEGQTTLMPLGARFVNRLGEPFMEKYSPVLGANTDPHYITMAMAKEVLAGRGPIYFDITPVKEEDRALIKPQAGWQLLNHEKLVALGIDFFHSNTEWTPQLQDLMAGVVTDIDGRTSVPGLYAAGRAKSIDPGVYIGGFSLSTTATTGYLAGQAVAEYLGEFSQGESFISQEQIEAYKRELYQPATNGGITPKEVLRKIQELVFPYDVCILKTKEGLQKALRQLEGVKQDLMGHMGAPDPHYLMKLHEVQGTAFMTELYLRASLAREESRAGHYREDFPKRSPDGLYWLNFVKDANNQIEMTKVPVPIEKYKYPIERYYYDNFNFS